MSSTPVAPPATPTLRQRIPAPSPVTIQEGDPLPAFRLLVQQSGELEDNRIGGFAGGLTGGGWKPGQPWDYAWMTDQVVGRGLKRFRVAIDNLDAGSPDLDWDIPQYTIDPSHDALITALAQQGVQITYVLTFWDKDTWPQGEGAECPRFKDEDQIRRYLEFVKYMVGHFKGRIQNYEIWNEPNTQVCPQGIEVGDYVRLVARAVPVIRQEDPGARIVVGATSYLGDPQAQEYLFTILSSDIMPLVDIVSWHPMYGTSPDFDPDYYAGYPATLQNIKDTASAHGFTGTYEADELTWFTADGQNWDGWSQRYSDTVAAKYTARGILMHLGRDVTAGVGSALLFDPKWEATPSMVHNLATTMAGARSVELPTQIESAAENVVTYTFAVRTDERLIAIWSDGKASDENGGVNGTLNVPNLTAAQVTGVDVLHGIEQELVAGDQNGNLVVENLLIKDYPLIIHLTGVSSP